MIAASIFVFQGLKAFCKEAIYTEEVQVDQTCFLFGLGILYMELSKDQFWVLDLCYSNTKYHNILHLCTCTVGVIYMSFTDLLVLP